MVGRAEDAPLSGPCPLRVRVGQMAVVPTCPPEILCIAEGLLYTWHIP